MDKKPYQTKEQKELKPVQVNWPDGTKGEGCFPDLPDLQVGDKISFGNSKVGHTGTVKEFINGIPVIDVDCDFLPAKKRKRATRG